MSTCRRRLRPTTLLLALGVVLSAACGADQATPTNDGGAYDSSSSSSMPEGSQTGATDGPPSASPDAAQPPLDATLDGAAAGAAPPLVNRYDGARSSTVSFDLAWKFHLGDAPGAEQSTFDDSAWTQLDVPHDWSIGLAFNPSSPAGAGGGYLDGGIGWYRKTFTIPAATSGKRVYLQFDGVYMDSTVWVNGVSNESSLMLWRSARLRWTFRRRTRRSEPIAVVRRTRSRDVVYAKDLSNGTHAHLS